MFQSIYDYILEYYSSSFWIGFFAYWVPVGICLIYGLFKTISNAVWDIRLNGLSDIEFKKMGHNSSSYSGDTVGSILWRVIGSFIPVYNIFKSLSFCPDVLGFIINKLEKIIDIKLVRRKIREI